MESGCEQNAIGGSVVRARDQTSHPRGPKSPRAQEWYVRVLEKGPFLLLYHCNRVPGPAGRT